MGNKSNLCFDRQVVSMKKIVLRPGYIISMLIIFGMFVLYQVAFQRHFSTTFLFCFDKIAMTIFRSRANLILLFQLAIGIHIFESLYALYLTITHNYTPKVLTIWVFQTLILGYPSLRLLILQIRENCE